MDPEQIIKRPLILTEKGNRMREDLNKYLFEVDSRSNSITIKNAVETLFNVHVDNVHTMVVRGRMRRMGRGHAKTRNWKKAIVTLKKGETINFFEGT